MGEAEGAIIRWASAPEREAIFSGPQEFVAWAVMIGLIVVVVKQLSNMQE